MVVGLVQLSSVRLREELEEGVLEGILEVVVLVVRERVGRCHICMDQGIRLSRLMRIDLLFKERELLWIDWNMERDVFDCSSCVSPTFLSYILSFLSNFSYGGLIEFCSENQSKLARQRLQRCNF